MLPPVDARAGSAGARTYNQWLTMLASAACRTDEFCASRLWTPPELIREEDLLRLRAALDRLEPRRIRGQVRACHGRTLLAAGLDRFVALGDPCTIDRPGQPPLLAEVVGFDEAGVRLVACGEPSGVVRGTPVTLDRRWSMVWPDPAWRGRVIDALARPLDGAGELPSGSEPRMLCRAPPEAVHRRPLGGRLSTGIAALDLFVPCVEGQRLGLFAGSGIGKSTLLSMLARNAEADVVVVGLIGERGREVREFLEHTLGPEGRARSVVVVATSDQPAMLRRRAAHLTLAVAEYFRDHGARVLCLFDSVTRYAMALREIFLAAGELPASRGYPASVFAELPRLLERAGPGTGAGNMTAFFSVLVEGDDHNEPVADSVRGILDGHVVLARRIAERGRFPAIDVLASLSRAAPACYTAAERVVVTQARSLLATFENMAELVDMGAYEHGTNPELDRAIALRPAIEALLTQAPDEPPVADPFARLAAILAQAESGRQAGSRP